MSPVADDATRVGEARCVYRKQSPYALRVNAPVKRGLVYDLTVVVKIAEIENGRASSGLHSRSNEIAAGIA